MAQSQNQTTKGPQIFPAGVESCDNGGYAFPFLTFPSNIIFHIYRSSACQGVKADVFFSLIHPGATWRATVTMVSKVSSSDPVSLSSPADI